MTNIAATASLLAVIAALGQGALADPKPEVDRPGKYPSYRQLVLAEKPGVDFKVVHRFGSRSFLIAAPHGGSIEPGSTEIADAIAGNDFGFYAFSGLKRDSSDLFLPSSRFDEPELRRVTKNYGSIISVHVIDGSDRLVYVGGNNRQLADGITASLVSRGYQVKSPPTQNTSAFNPNNFINKSPVGGVQIEITSAVAQDMFRGPVTSDRIRQDPSRRTAEFSRFVQAIRLVLERSGSKSSGIVIHPKEETDSKK